MRNNLNNKIKGYLIFCIFFFCAGQTLFSQQVASLHAIFNEQTALDIPRVEGNWYNKGIPLTISIKKAGDNFYRLSYGTDQNRATFEAVFFKIKDILLVDLSGVMPDDIKDYFYRGSFLHQHSLFKVQVTEDRLSLARMDYTWLCAQARKNELPLKYEWVDNGMLITSAVEEWMMFFSEFGSEHKLFEQSDEFIKDTIGAKKDIIRQQNDFLNINSKDLPQKCLPEFPFKDGWLGGDGDVSVSINKTQTLFIFSDSYVAIKSRDTRGEGVQMVSNSIAVETCMPGGKTAVQYFWNNMYSENPEPFFKTYTNRYRFWVNDAFMLNGCLYVVLVKISPKKGAAPGEIFNFTQLGYTLAKVSNPLESPDKWLVKLIPLPDFSSPDMEIQAHVIKDNYLYLYLNRNQHEQLLVRKKSALIDSPLVSFEYYSKGENWVSPIRKEDMYVLIKGFRPTTVNYHPDIRQWIMVCDISFMDNKIKIRTAPEITGPWSDEIPVYECPETTPGSLSYSKSNFCYLPRECIQNYDMKNQVMLITYDINSSNMVELNSNPSIYTPKVIKVSLRQFLPQK